MEYVLPKHVADFVKERDTLNKRIQELETTNDILRTNVRDLEIMLRDARIRIKELTT
jgi:predicted  nucleic acid-binding Zn-ribbon protein|tara:strand:+ start:313 stop:483 length:171 start_codon:yes stop_codon:yes gene_type:complete